mgnify:CR=1 FL=1
MALQNSGAISLSDIQNEFGGSNPINISEYYRGGNNVPNISANSNIPTGGTISFNDFYGGTNVSISVSPSSFTGNGFFDSFTLFVTSDTSWTVTTTGTDNGNWINPSVTSGTGSTSFTVTIQRNTTGTTNFGTVKVSGGGASDSCSIAQPNS